jgi:hypothetical protein
LRRGAVRCVLLLVSVSLMSCSNVVEVRHPIPGTGAFWIEKVPVYKRPRASRVPKTAQKTAQPPTPRYDEGEWHGDSLSGPPSMLIRLGEQKIYFYKGGQLAGVTAGIVPHAREVAVLAARLFARGETVDAEHAAPLYVRNKVALSTSERAAGASQQDGRK